jgi:hypothetical protein
MTPHRHTNTLDCSASAAASPLDAEELRTAWREARDEAAATYRNWCEAPAAQRRPAHAAFLAAADREAAAEQAFLLTVRHR